MDTRPQHIDTATDADDRLLAEQVRLVLRRRQVTGWDELDDGFWFAVQPPTYLPRTQGWKLHVSATPLSAALVVARTAEVLVAAGCAFKVARGVPQVLELVASTCDRGSSGKVITAYPADDAEVAALADALHRATAHLPGPAILSDHPYRPGSLVHLRFGAFTGHTELGNDGTYESLLRAPDGTLEPDLRTPWFSPPSWAGWPLPETPAAAGTGPVLLAGRFLVRHALQHGNKGGVYLGIDETTGEDVVVKQARPHVGAMLDGSDARDLLRHEARLLERLAPHGVTPRPLGLHAEAGHLFLAQERITGTTLLDWVDRLGEGTDPAAPGERAALPLAAVLPVAEQLVDLIATVHAEGLVLRDLSPTNLMVTPDGRLRLVDLEFAAVPGEPAPVVGTPGYGAPEQIRFVGTTGIAPAPQRTADLYSLGALLLLMSSGVDPALAPDRPAARPLQQRLARLVRRVAVASPAVRAIAPAVIALLADDPADRWDLDTVRAFLADLRRPTPAVITLPEPDRLPADAQDALLDGGLAFLLDAMAGPGAERLWPAAADAADGDPRNVQAGAAGVLALLTRATQLRDDPRLPAAAARAATWLERSLTTGARLLPGLHFGASGPVWALFDAARLLDDDGLARRALDLATTIPVRWPNPDVCHGAAGAGMAQLHLWRTTGDPAMAARVHDCADGLVRAAIRRDGRVEWPIPAAFDSALAGLTHYGFAHGVAGIGAFLLAAGLATGDDATVATADAAAATLHSLARRDGDAAWWPVGEERDPSDEWRMPHWCSGSSGIGTFLARHWAATGDPRSRELAHAAACAVRGARWHMTTAACHGLAGDGEFLLDLAAVLDDDTYHGWARDLASCLDARSVVRDGYLLLPDESGTEVSASYGTGLAGPLSFLLRLRHGGPRPLMSDGTLLAGRAVRAADGTIR